MHKYRLTAVPVRFWVGWTEALREFSAYDDTTAVQHAEHPIVPLRFIHPDGGTVDYRPRRLIELVDQHATRIVKEWP
jgi:hypothetical protein